MNKIIQQRFQEHLEVTHAVMDSGIMEQIERIARQVKKTLARGDRK